MTVRQMIGDACRTLQKVHLCGQYFTGLETAQAVIDVYQLTDFWIGQEGYNKHEPGISDEDWNDFFQGTRRGIDDLRYPAKVKLEAFPTPLCCEYCTTYVSEGIRAGPCSFCCVCLYV